MPEPSVGAIGRLKEMGIVLPEPPKPAGYYVPVRITHPDGGTAYVSGQIPVRDGRVVFAGRVSDGNIDEARDSARLCLLNVLAQLRGEMRRRNLDLDDVAGFSMLSGFVSSDPEFHNHHKVMDAASELLSDIFGDRGCHSRIAVGVSCLPLNSMTEISAVAEISL